MRTLSAKERVAKVAGRQFGRISRYQLTAQGIANATVQRWLTQGYLHRVLPRVYAVGHTAHSTEAGLAAAVLYAGPAAMLSHATAAWWVGLADSRPYIIDVSTPRRSRSLPGIRVHQRRAIGREWHRGLPVTAFVQTLLDYATQAPRSQLRRALARAEYSGSDLSAVEAELSRPRAGAARLRTALRRHQPGLALTRSELEVIFFELCERGRFPLPEINAEVAGWPVDALWRREHLVVEIDGWGNHRTPAQIRRDRRMDFELRDAGLVVLRYSDEQVTQDEGLLIVEIRRNLSRPETSA